jgi:hypothetical protein
VKPHWGGPVKYLDVTRSTPYIVVKNSEKKAMLDELQGKINNKELDNLFSFLRDREIVDISFKE